MPRRLFGPIQDRRQQPPPPEPAPLQQPPGQVPPNLIPPVSPGAQPQYPGSNPNAPVGGTQFPTNQQDLIDLFRNAGASQNWAGHRPVTPFESRQGTQSAQFNTLNLLSDLAFQAFLQQGGFNLSPSQSDYDLSNQIFGNLRQQATGNLMTGADQMAQGLAAEFAKRGLSGSGFEAGQSALLQRGLNDQLANILSGISAQQGQFLTQAPYRRNQQLFDQIMGPRTHVLDAATRAVLGYQGQTDTRGSFGINTPFGGFTFPT